MLFDANVCSLVRAIIPVRLLVCHLTFPYHLICGMPFDLGKLYRIGPFGLDNLREPFPEVSIGEDAPGCFG